MTRTLILALLLLCVLGSESFATEQIRERIVVDGRVYRISVTPLESLLDAKGKRLNELEPMATNLWRGYVGTWSLEDDRLYLVSMIRPSYEDAGPDDPPRRVDKTIPLSVVFGDRPGPIEATWWSGQLRVPRGGVLGPDSRCREPLHEKMLYLNVENGRVVSKRLVDHRADGRGLSPEDIQWVTRVPDPPEDDGAWHDARSIRTEAFHKAVPQGTEFRTRGHLAVARGATPCLYVHHTPATDMVRLEIRALAPDGKPGTFLHAELTATWASEGSDTVLHVVAWRALDPGETIHHPRFEAPALKESRLQPADEELDPLVCSDLRHVEDLPYVFGRTVAIRGTLAGGEIWAIQGVQVEADEALAGKPVVVAGLLEKWVVTKKLIERDPVAAARFGTRGPGSYYCLAHPTTGKLARPRPAE